MSVEFILQQRVHKKYIGNLRFLYKKAGDSIWRTGYSIREYDAGIGIFQDAIRYYQKNKKKMTVTEKRMLMYFIIKQMM